MPALKYDDLRLEQGGTFDFAFDLKDCQTGDALDLSGYTAEMTLKPSPDSTSIMATLTTDNGKLTIDAETGRVAGVLTDEETQALDFSRLACVYSLFITDSDGRRTAIVYGSIPMQRF